MGLNSLPERNARGQAKVQGPRSQRTIKKTNQRGRKKGGGADSKTGERYRKKKNVPDWVQQQMLAGKRKEKVGVKGGSSRLVEGKLNKRLTGG